MSVSLDDIWDVPATQTPTRPRAEHITDDDLPGPSPSKKRRSTLFLSSDSEGGSPKKTAAKKDIHKKAQPDIDALFDDLDDDNDGFQDLAPSLDLTALRRQADARNVQLTSREILPSSSPGREVNGAATGGGKDGKDKDGEKPKRKVLPKLDETRLLSTDGFPALVKQTTHFKPKGKGHEASDLARLMQVYQFWAHKIYPKGHFRDNVQRIEKLCHTKRMHNALSVWRDESKGLIHGRKMEDLIDLTSDGEHADDESGDDVNVRQNKDDASAKDAISEAAASSPPPRPPSSASERTSIDADDDFDIDAVIQAEEERAAAQSRRASSPSFNQNNSVYRTRNVDPVGSLPDITDDDEAMWNELNGDFNDEAGVPQSVPDAPAPPPHVDDEDEDMWDVVREMEEEIAPKPPTVANKGATDVVAATGPAPTDEQPTEQPRPTNDEGWDEMYL